MLQEGEGAACAYGYDWSGVAVVYVRSRFAGAEALAATTLAGLVRAWDRGGECYGA